MYYCFYITECANSSTSPVREWEWSYCNSIVYFLLVEHDHASGVCCKNLLSESIHRKWAATWWTAQDTRKGRSFFTDLLNRIWYGFVISLFNAVSSLWVQKKVSIIKLASGKASFGLVTQLPWKIAWRAQREISWLATIFAWPVASRWLQIISRCTFPLLRNAT